MPHRASLYAMAVALAAVAVGASFVKASVLCSDVTPCVNKGTCNYNTGLCSCPLGYGCGRAKYTQLLEVFGTGVGGVFCTWALAMNLHLRIFCPPRSGPLCEDLFWPACRLSNKTATSGVQRMSCYGQTCGIPLQFCYLVT